MFNQAGVGKNLSNPFQLLSQQIVQVRRVPRNSLNTWKDAFLDVCSPSRSLKQQETSPSRTGISMGWVVAAALDALGTSVTQRDKPYDEMSPRGSGTICGWNNPGLKEEDGAIQRGSMRSAAANALPSGRLQAAELLVYQRRPTHWPGSLILTNMAKILILSPVVLSPYHTPPPPLPFS